MKKGKRFNVGKIRPSSYPIHLHEATHRVASYGAAKYGDHNFLQGQDYSTLYDSFMRHFVKLSHPAHSDYDLVERDSNGRALKPGSGLHHADHMAWNIETMAYNFNEGLDDLDDRFKGRASTYERTYQLEADLEILERWYKEEKDEAKKDHLAFLICTGRIELNNRKGELADEIKSGQAD